MVERPEHRDARQTKPRLSRAQEVLMSYQPHSKRGVSLGKEPIPRRAILALAASGTRIVAGSSNDGSEDHLWPQK